MRALLLAVTILTTACEVPSNPVRIEYIDPFVQGMCELRAQCGIREHFDWCYRHNIAHLCGITDTCFDRIDVPDDVFDACIKSLSEVDETCVVIDWIVATSECADFYALIEDGVR